MFLVSLVGAIVVLCLANLAMRKAENPAVIILLMVIGSSVSIFCQVFSPPIFIQSIALLLLSQICRGRKREYLVMSILATLGIFGFISADAWVAIRLQQQDYPRISLEDRLPDVDSKVASLKSELRNWEESEMEIDEQLRHNWRAENLKGLHEDAVNMFVNRPGFGWARGMSIRQMLPIRRPERSPKQPGVRSAPLWSAGADAMKPAPAAWSFLWEHRTNVVEFANPLGWGWVDDEKHVTGFEEHGFRRESSQGEANLKTLDLVGLLLAKEPRVYVSDELPRMKDLAKIPTRPLDVFEAMGLDSLRRGEDLFARKVGGELRVLGALRMLKQCTQCHDGERGELLGAFSYTFAN